MKKISLLTFTVILILIHSHFSFSQKNIFTSTYGGSNDDRGLSVKPTFDGGYIVAGSTNSFGHGGNDVYLIRLDANGDTLWTHTYGGSEADEGFSVDQCSDSGFVIAGYTRSSGQGNCDFYFIKTYKDGAVERTETFGDFLYEGSYIVHQTSDNGYILAGYTNSEGLGGKDVLVIKLDAGFEYEWKNTYGTAYDDEAFDLIEAKGGDYVICGYTETGNGDKQLYLIKTDADGNEIWNNNIGGENSDEYGNSIKPTGDGGYIIAGQKENGEDYDMLLVKTDSEGNEQWSRTYGGNENDIANCVIDMGNDLFFLCGSTESYGSNTINSWYVCVDYTGDTVWTVVSDMNSDNYSEEAALTPNGNIITAGSVKTSSFPLLWNVVVEAWGHCYRWYPRAMQVNNMWCRPNACYPGLPDILESTSSQDSLINYLRHNKITNLIIGNLDDALFEDAGFNQDTSILGDTLRSRLATLIKRARSEAKVKEVTFVLRNRSAEDRAVNDSLLVFLNRFRAFNQANTDSLKRFDELCLDIEYWLDTYGDPLDTSAVQYSLAGTGWTNYKQMTDTIIAVKNDTANHINRLSTMLGHIDRNVDGIAGDDEQLQADYVDSLYNRMYLFFFLKDSLPYDMDYDPTFFLTSVRPQYINLRKRIGYFGYNSQNSEIWPMFSAEDSLGPGPGADNRYLGRWLQGTWYWSPTQHYLTEAQNIFNDQYEDYRITGVYDDFPTWVNWAESINIYGYSFFAYQRKPLDSLRYGDKIWNYNDCPFALRTAHSFISNQGDSQSDPHNVNSIENRLSQELDELYDLTGRKINFNSNKNSDKIENLKPGIYIHRAGDNGTVLKKIIVR